VAWAKTRWRKWGANSSCADNFLNNRKGIGIYPLKQFAHVIHGNPNAQGRTAMGAPSTNSICLSGKETSAQKGNPSNRCNPLFFCTHFPCRPLTFQG